MTRNNGPIKPAGSMIRRFMYDQTTIDENHQAYVNFVSSLKTYITKKAYTIRLKNYLKSPLTSFSTFDELLNRDPRLIEQGIIDILVEMRHTRNMSFSAQNMLLCALTHFFSINDKIINRKKIAKFMSDSENKFEYRSYTTDEIASLLSLSDEREKMIILLLSSTGMRVGALHQLRLKDLKKWKMKGSDLHVYKIRVYSSSSKYNYVTFCTPECARSIDNYLDLRTRFGENLDMTNDGWTPTNCYLIIRAFNRKSNFHSPLPIKYRSSITSNIIVPKLKSLNLRSRSSFYRDLNNTFSNSNGEDILHPCHSFRIFAITQMQKAGVDKTVREMLVGHSTGLDSVYYKPSDEEIFLEYQKAIGLLSISKENNLKAKIKELECINNQNDLVNQSNIEYRDQQIEILKEQYLSMKKIVDELVKGLSQTKDQSQMNAVARSLYSSGLLQSEISSKN